MNGLVNIFINNGNIWSYYMDYCGCWW